MNRQGKFDNLRKAGEKLETHCYHMEQTFLDAPHWIFHKDAANKILRLNEACAHDLGGSPADFEGRSIEEIFPEEQAQKFLKNDLEVITTGIPKLNILEPANTINGSRWFRTDKYPLKNRDGQIVGIVGIAVDVTDIVAKAKEL